MLTFKSGGGCQNTTTPESKCAKLSLMALLDQHNPCSKKKRVVHQNAMQFSEISRGQAAEVLHISKLHNGRILRVFRAVFLISVVDIFSLTAKLNCDVNERRMILLALLAACFIEKN